MIQTKCKEAALICIGLLSIAKVYAQKPVELKVQDKLYYTAEAVNMNGFLKDKLDLAYDNRILVQDVARLVEPFSNRNETRCWQSEFWGKWFTSAVLAYRYKPEAALKSKIDDAVTKLLATQTPDGYIGNYADTSHLERWDIWGRKYCMLGLLSYYDLTKDKKSLKAAAAIADHLIKELKDKQVNIVDKGSHKGMAATSVLEPITLLYVRTGEKRFLDFANEIVRQWELPTGPQLISKAGINVADRFPIPKIWYGHEQGSKAYEMMSCYEGLLELYRVTGNESYRAAVEKVWQNISDTEINVAGSGSSMECWFGGKKLQVQSAMHYQETCVTATWIKLSLQLLRLTGAVKYAEAIEQSYYNALLGSMKTDGSSWAKYSPILGIRTAGGDQCNMGINCCIASGPRALFAFPAAIVMKSANGINVNFYSGGSFASTTPSGQRAEVIQETDYPANGNVSISLKMAKTEAFDLNLRIPQWSKVTKLLINGEEISGVVPGSFKTIRRNWKNGDRLTVGFDMRGRVEKISGDISYMAIFRGPIVLARDARFTGSTDTDELITPVVGKDGFVPLEVVKSAVNGVYLTYKIFCQAGSYRDEEKRAPVALVFCDYASAGDTYTEQSRFRIWFPQPIDFSKSSLVD